MKLLTALKFLACALVLVSVTACGKKGKGNNRSNCNNSYNSAYNNGYNNQYNRNGYNNGYNNQYNNNGYNRDCYRNNNNYQGQYAQQPYPPPQQQGYPQQSTYPRPERPVIIEREEEIEDYRRVSQRDTTVVDSELEGDDDYPTQRPPYPPPPPPPYQERPTYSQPAQRQVPPGPPAGLPRVRVPAQPSYPQQAERPPYPPPATQPSQPYPQQTQRPPMPPPPSVPQPERQDAQSYPQSGSRTGIEIVYKDELDGRNLSRANPALSQSAYKSVIEEMVRRNDLESNYMGQGVPDSVYPASRQRNNQYAYLLDVLVSRLKETGACDFKQNRGCVVVETYKDGSVSAYYVAIHDEGANGQPAIYPALKRDIINTSSRFQSDIENLARIEGNRITVYSQLNRNQAGSNISASVPAAAPVASPAVAPAAAARPGQVQLPGEPPTSVTSGQVRTSNLQED